MKASIFTATIIAVAAPSAAAVEYNCTIMDAMEVTDTGHLSPESPFLKLKIGERFRFNSDTGMIVGTAFEPNTDDEVSVISAPLGGLPITVVVTRMFEGKAINSQYFRMDRLRGGRWNFLVANRYGAWSGICDRQYPASENRAES